MTFAATLDAYCIQLGFSNKTIATYCDVSPSALSRYRSGMRTPDADSPTIDSLARGIAALAARDDTPRQPGQKPIDFENVRDALNAEIVGHDMVGMDFHMRLDMLMHVIGISNAEMAATVQVDPSFISRIRRGQRMPGSYPKFLEPCARLAARLCLDKDVVGEVGDLIGYPSLAAKLEVDGLDAESNLAESIGVWLAGDRIVNSNIGELWQLLLWLDQTEFGTSTQPDAHVACKPVPDIESIARFYYGIDGMRNAEIAFLSLAADSCARELSMSSDMPLLQLELDPGFQKSYTSGISKVIEFGGHINIIHDVERPLAETIQAMRLWFPLYMTGKVTPYYLRGIYNHLFCHVNYVCDTCALSSEAVMGHQEEGRYFLTTRDEDITYYQRKMKRILEKSTSLLEIYRDCDPGMREAFEESEELRRASGRGHPIGENRFENISVIAYPPDCTVLSVPYAGSPVHFVIRHPKFNYAAAHM